MKSGTVGGHRTQRQNHTEVETFEAGPGNHAFRQEHFGMHLQRLTHIRFQDEGAERRARDAVRLCLVAESWLTRNQLARDILRCLHIAYIKRISEK
jgi:hypothetical protein